MPATPKTTPATPAAKKAPAKRTSTKQTPDPKVVAEKLAAATPKASSPADQDFLLEVTTDEERAAWPAADTNTAKRLKTAEAEFTKLKAWDKAGRKGNCPPCPNLAMLREKHANGGVEPKKSGVKSKSTGERKSTLGPRGQEAMAARSAMGGKHSDDQHDARVKLTDDELEAYIRKVMKDHPESSMVDERKFANWVENMVVGKFDAFWIAIANGDPIPKAEPKAPRAPRITKDEAFQKAVDEAVAARLAELGVKVPAAKLAKAGVIDVDGKAPEVPAKAEAEKVPAKKVAQAASRKATPPKATTAVRKSQKDDRAAARAAAGK